MTLDGSTLKDPNSFGEEPVVTGSMNKTMRGGVRRAKRATKKIWNLGWTNLRESDYTTLNTIFNKDTTVVFINTALTPSISATVHVDLSPRRYLSGTGCYLSQVELILTEV